MVIVILMRINNLIVQVTEYFNNTVAEEFTNNENKIGKVYRNDVKESIMNKDLRNDEDTANHNYKRCTDCQIM